MRRIAWIGLAVVLGAGVWLLLRDTAPTPATRGTERSPTTSAGDRPVLVGSPVDSALLPAGFAPPPPPGHEGTDPTEGKPVGSGRVVGRVIDTATGAGAVGAWVHAAPLHADPPFPHAVIDAEGHFAIEEVPAGDVFVVVLGGGWHGSDVGDLCHDMMSSTPSKAAQIDADETERVELEAVRAASVEGRVFDAGGREVAGARVRPIATPLHYDSWLIPAAPLEATSAADGSFRLDTLVAGLQYRVQALTTDVAPGLSEPFHADPHAPAHVDVHLPPLRTLEVEVRSAADSMPIPNAAASWDEADPAVPNMNHGSSAEGNREGRIHVGPLAPGAMSVEVSASGFASETVKLTPEDEGQIHRVVSLELGLVLAGRVLDRDGRAVPGAWVTCGRGEEARNQTASTDQEGAFRFEGLLAGDWTLAVWVGDGTADLTVQAEAGREDLVLRVQQAFTPGLVIHVLDPEGKPIPRFEVVTATACGMGAGDWEDGRFEIEAGQDAEYVELRRAHDGLRMGEVQLEDPDCATGRHVVDEELLLTAVARTSAAGTCEDQERAGENRQGAAKQPDGQGPSPGSGSVEESTVSLIYPSTAKRQWVETDQGLDSHHLPEHPRPRRTTSGLDRRLHGLMARAARDTLRDALREAALEPDGVPGAVVALQTFGSFGANFHPTSRARHRRRIHGRRPLPRHVHQATLSRVRQTPRFSGGAMCHPLKPGRPVAAPKKAPRRDARY